MASLNATGAYELKEKEKGKLQKLFSGYFCDDKETQRTIARVWREHQYLIDPHTAVGFSALEQYREETGDETPCLVASTASPFKFCGSVLGALGVRNPAEGLDALGQLSQLTGLPAPAPLAGLKDKVIRFRQVTDREKMADAVLSTLV